MTGREDKEGRRARERERERLSRLYSDAGSETGGYAKRMSPRDTAHRLPTFTSGRDGKLRVSPVYELLLLLLLAVKHYDNILLSIRSLFSMISIECSIMAAEQEYFPLKIETIFSLVKI